MLVEVDYILLRICGHSIVTVRGVSFPGKSVSKVFNVITVTRGWVGVPFPGKKHYVTLEWPQCHAFNYSNTDESITFELRDSCEVWVAMDVDLGVDGCVGVSEQFLDAVSCDGSKPIIRDGEHRLISAVVDKLYVVPTLEAHHSSLDKLNPLARIALRPPVEECASFDTNIHIVYNGDKTSHGVWRDCWQLERRRRGNCIQLK